MNRRVLPGFHLSLGFATAYLTVMVLIPLAACLAKAMSLSREQFWKAVWTDQARAAYGLTFGASLIAASINVGIGLLVAWVLVRYKFPLKRLLDSLVDLPFALPTAVAGLVYSNLYADHGWLGQYLSPLGIHGAYSRLGIVLVLVFTGLPFVVRAVEPVLESLDADTEEAAQLLGATRVQTFLRIILPTLMPALVTGFALSFARAVGEYGSVVFISGNLPYRAGGPPSTQIAPVLIVEKLDQAAYGEATAIAVVLLGVSFLALIAINLLERWSKRFY